MCRLKTRRTLDDDSRKKALNNTCFVIIHHVYYIFFVIQKQGENPKTRRNENETPKHCGNFHLKSPILFRACLCYKPVIVEDIMLFFIPHTFVGLFRIIVSHRHSILKYETHEFCLVTYVLDLCALYGKLDTDFDS